MGSCSSKPPKRNPYAPPDFPDPPKTPQNNHASKTSSPLYNLTPLRLLLNKKSPESSANSTPTRGTLPPLSPAKHIMAVLTRWRGKLEGDDTVIGLDKRFGLSKGFKDRYEVGEEVGRGHFGFTVSATPKSGDHAGQKVAVKVIPKAKDIRTGRIIGRGTEDNGLYYVDEVVQDGTVMLAHGTTEREAWLWHRRLGHPSMTTAIAIEDVRREVKILRALTIHGNVAEFYDAFEDNDNVYIVMELCEGGELLDRILTRRGEFTEDESMNIMVQILNVVAFFHLQGVAHRDLKPENFLLKMKDDYSLVKAIDFGLSDFVKPDEKMNDIVGSAYYVAPEVLLKSYDTEADMWSVGVIAYILLCGSRPFWARTESGIFRAVLKTVPSFVEPSWSSLSPLAKHFVQRLLNKDPRKRMTAAQALTHPWIRDHSGVDVPIDIRVLRSLKAYTRSPSLRQAALRSLSKTLTTDDLFYLKKQFTHLAQEQSKSVTFGSIKTALKKHETNAMKESRITDYLNWLTEVQLDFEEFCAAAVNVIQLESLERWEQLARCAYEIFDKDANRVIVIEELATELGLGPLVPLDVVLSDWIRHPDGKLSFAGFTKLLHGISTRNQRRLR